MISGPIIEPSSGLPPKQLIIFVHGYGADGNDLIGLASYFQSVLPDAIFLSPHAPEACSMNPAGYQWFDLTSTDPAVLWNKILVAADHLNEFIDAKLLEYNLSSFFSSRKLFRICYCPIKTTLRYWSILLPTIYWILLFIYTSMKGGVLLC